MTEKLKPCPFCGGEAAKLCTSWKLVIVFCTTCKNQTAIFFSQSDAIQAWNKRVNNNE
ncbi:Lar family restriction alleviation protein [Photorhabdus sp. SF281]|uniref:Lar family restriction alleviation protein n=1 Tax=Photorhabdus sp. SF281 TaxID=3459527 RepID=UPI004044EEB4